MLLTDGDTAKSKIPMDLLSYTQQETEADKNLIIFLRGIEGSHRLFQREGFVDRVRELALPYDMVAPDTHFGYYSDRSLVRRLREDIILPKKQEGYKHIWLVGVSMGGLGALLYLREHPGDISGVYLIAPFLGDKKIVTALEQAGGVLNWNPGSYNAEEDWQKMLWDWIQTEVAKGSTPPVYLGAGLADTFIEGQRLLAAILPPESSIWLEGGHHHSTFASLWNRFLEKNVLD